jgi:hypothetical protein
MPIDLGTTPEGEFLVGTGTCRQPLRIRLSHIVHARDPVAGEDFAKGWEPPARTLVVHSRSRRALGPGLSSYSSHCALTALA